MHYALIPAGGVRPEQVMGGMQMPQPLSLEKSQICLPLQSLKVMHLTRKRSWCESSQNLKKERVTFYFYMQHAKVALFNCSCFTLFYSL
jgi:hypothetical protein